MIKILAHCGSWRGDNCTHFLEEYSLVNIPSNIAEETRFTNKLMVSFFFFLVCFDDNPLQKVLKSLSCLITLSSYGVSVAQSFLA